MLRAFLCAAMVLGLMTVGLRADNDKKDSKNTSDKNSSQTSKNSDKNSSQTSKNSDKHGQEAKITHVDSKNHTLTVQMKDKNGKEVERTFRLTEDVRMIDDTGRAAAIDVFQSGNDVLIVEAEGRLREVHKNRHDNNNSSNQKNAKGGR